jgi:biopolymer transport protein ExbD
VTIAVNFAPMIDVTFLLLIFFLVTTTFERAEGILASQMPKDSGQRSVALPLSPIVVRHSQESDRHGDFLIRLDRFPNQPATFLELTETIRQIHELPGFDHETPVIIVAGDDVRWDHVVGCWNATVRAGCRSVAFGEP